MPFGSATSVARHDEEVGASPRRRGLPDFLRHRLGRNHALAALMATTLRRLLIFDEQRRSADGLVAAHGPRHILHVAIAIVAVEHRQASMISFAFVWFSPYCSRSISGTACICAASAKPPI